MARSLPSTGTSTRTEDARRLGRWFAAARREGLLPALPPSAWHTLSALLSFTTRDGERRFTLEQLALTLGQSKEVARQRLEELAAARWQDQPLATLHQSGDGDIMGADLPSVELFSRVEPP